MLIFLLLLETISYSQNKNLGGTPVQGIIAIKRDQTNIGTSKTENTSKATTTTLAPSNPTGGSQEVGITEGQLDVSLTGGATYNIPIAVPPGNNGIVPQVSLAYNSQGGNSLAGYGWNITGVSAITRIPSTKFHDGIIDAVDFDNLDRFAFDGQRLMLKSGTYGGNGAEYETENFSNIKITSIGVSPFGANYGPAYFLVQYPDGSLAQYGASTDSQSKTDWAITFWQNPQGVRINYNYTVSNNSIRITSIKYGAIGSNTPINEIQFIYRTRNRPESLFLGGENFILNSILSEISVLGNGIGFRNYILSHDVTSLGYERLTSITEKSGDNAKSFNPTIFKYEDLSNSITLSDPLSYISTTNTTQYNTGMISGDFTGKGNMDFILYPTNGPNAKNQYWLFSNIQEGTNATLGYIHNVGNFEKIFPISWLGGSETYGYKLMPMQGWNVVAYNESTNTTTFTNYSKGDASPIYFQDVKSYKFPKFINGYYNECIPIVNPANNNQDQQAKTVDPIGTGPVYIEVIKVIPKEYLNGDFNGDGISDVIVVEKSFTYCMSSGCNTYTVTNNSGSTYFVNLDRRLTSNYVNASGHVQITLGSKLEVADVNGDGKSDVLMFDSGRVIAYSLNENKQLEQLWVTNDSDISVVSERPTLIGDYNGDGKTDFIIPQGFGQVFAKFISTGNGFVKSVETYQIANKDFYNDYLSYDTFDYGNIIPNDINKDGKTDLVLAKYRVDRVNNGVSTFDINVKFYTNVSNNFILTSEQDLIPGYENSTCLPLPIFLPSDKINNSLELGFVYQNKIVRCNSPKDFSKEKLLKSITVGNGLTESITYKPLIEEEGYNSDNILLYKPSTNIENYPNTDVKGVPSFQVVSKLEKQSQNTYKKQLFGYYGAVSNVEGQGFLGFRSLCRTNWHNDNLQVISSVTKHDIAKRGALIESYSFLNTSYNFELTPSDFISKSVINYDSSLSSNKVFKIWNTTAISTNGLDGTSSETSTQYDEYNNPTINTSIIKSGSIVEQSETGILTYLNQPTGTTYYIGRPQKKNTSITHNGDTTTAEEIYTYNSNHLLSQIQKKGHLTNYIAEDNEYDTFGNITKKIITATPLAPRINNYEYDTSGRFLIKSTDIEGLNTQFAYNTSNGLLNSETNPYGLTTQYFYDVWGKKIKTTDYLGKSVNTTYTKPEPTTSLINTISDDGSSSTTKYDDLDREIDSGTKHIDNQWSYVTTQYDDYDRKVKVYEPHLPNNGSNFTAYTYDGYGRLIKTVEPTTKTTNITYSGLTTVVSDGLKTVTTTKNSLGNPVFVTDNGGTINYTYFANGNLKNTNFEGTIISMEYDGWGKKTKLTDPSAGTYLYEYNALGESTKEVKPNPKGEINYTLDSFGKITEKRITSADNLTDSKTTYTYDPTSKLVTASRYDDFLEGTHTDYTYTYDASKRIIKTTESNLATASFEHQTKYDDFGRPLKELYSATNYANGKTSNKWVRNTYKNGCKWQIIDEATSQILWQKNTVNAKGQLISGRYGSGITVSNSYDQFGFPTQFKHEFFDDGIVVNGTIGVMVNVMTLNTTFEPIRGNLTSRSNSLFAVSQTTTTNSPTGPVTTTSMVPYAEIFKYDSLDRLTEWGAVPETLLNLGFQYAKLPLPANLEQFIPVAGGVLTNNLLSKLNIATTAANSGGERNVFANATSGTKLRFKADVNKNGTDKIRLVAVEKNITTGIETPYELGLANEGTFEIDYTVASSNVNLFLRFVKSPLSTDVGTLKNFRIDNVIVSKIVSEIQSYDNKGRITKNKLGDYNYINTSKQYQNTSVFTTPEANNYYSLRPLQNVSYNAFKSPVQITEQGIEKIDFSYNTFNNRSAMYYGGLQVDKLQRSKRKFYDASGTMEIKYNTNGVTEFITYIGGDGYSAPITLRSDGTTQEYLYLHRDYQGSIMAITNQAGVVLEKCLFDPWGSIVKVQDGAGNTLAGLTVLDRGYTGHEHLEKVGLINMNGRIYDPKLHRFLQPDNNIQDPYNTQNYNRYAYVMNNPLMYTDPSGEFWHIVIGAVIGGVINWGVHGFRFDMQGLKAFGIGAGAGALGALTGGAAFAAAGGAAAGAGGALAGAAGSAVGAGVSSSFLSLGNHFVLGDPLMTTKQIVTGIVIGGITGGLFQGASALLNGKSFWTGTAPRIAVKPITLQAAGLAETKGSGLQQNGEKIESSMPKLASPKEMTQAAKPTTFSKVTTVDGKTSWKTDGFKVVEDSGTNSVYQGVDKATGQVKYYGITERVPEVRFGEHLNSIGTGKELLRYEVIDGMENLSRINARILEQSLINQAGKSNLLNIRNSIAPKFWSQYGINP